MRIDLKIDDVNKPALKVQGIHPHKFTLWIGIASIVMMFAGLTSAYIVRKNMANWVGFEVPRLFIYSTAAIVLSSITMILAQRNFKAKKMLEYRRSLSITWVLGIVFVVLQVIGFKQLIVQGSPLGKTNSIDFLYVIVGLHGLHVLAGVIALLVLFANAFSSKIRNSNSVPVEVVGSFWHFVDLLWIYLLVFLVMIK